MRGCMIGIGIVGKVRRRYFSLSLERGGCGVLCFAWGAGGIGRCSAYQRDSSEARIGRALGESVGRRENRMGRMDRADVEGGRWGGSLKAHDARA